MNSVGIFGYGRFGKLLASLLADEFSVKVYDPKQSIDDSRIESVSKTALLKEKDIFIAVPINHFESLISSIATQLLPGTTIIDTCSVKIYPVRIMEKYLPKTVDIIATHPLFGPDSITSSEQLNFMIHAVRDNNSHYQQWKEYFTKKGFQLVEMSPDEHDRQAAESQGVVHFITRCLKSAELHPTRIDTFGFKQLLKLIENNCHDSWELFSDLQNYNPYSKPMIEKLEQALKKTKSILD
jgi:prephenate dehydrogenase